MPNVTLRLFALLIAAATLAGVPGTALAQGADERPTRREIWDIQLGAKMADLPDDFIDYACGTNGGPPSTLLTGWKDYRGSRPGANGLREVYFRYDDELEYWAKANNLAAQMEQYVGTKTYGFPINVSVLFRDEAYLLRNFLNARFGREGWQCEDLAAEGGETPVSGIFIKQRCQKDMDNGGRRLWVTRHLRKP